jgi:hypothetical protein
MAAKAGDTAPKLAESARQAGDQAKQAAFSLASDATKQAKGFLNMQVTAGADMVGHVVDSARMAAENLERDAPQLAGLVRSVADRAEEFSQDLRGRTVEDLIRTASDLTRKQPALVFGLACLAGFLAFRVLKSRPPRLPQGGVASLPPSSHRNAAGRLGAGRIAANIAVASGLRQGRRFLRPQRVDLTRPTRVQSRFRPGGDRTAWLRWSDSNSEMSAQIIPLKGRTDLRESGRILTTETIRV